MLISLFILNSCKNQDTIGLGVNSGNQINGAFLVDSNINVYTVPEDSLVTYNLAKTPLSYFNDKVFGTTEANIGGILNLPNSVGYTLPTGTIYIDSAVLVLPYAAGFYGDSVSTRYKVNVYQLAKKPVVSPVTTYYNTTRFSVDTTKLLGTRTFAARPNTHISIYSIISGAPDTLMKVAPQLRVPINIPFINNIIFNANGSVLGSNPYFQNVVKGLYITLDKTKTIGEGASFYMDMTGAKIDVFYRSVGSTATDTSSISLPVTNYAASIKHTYTATINAAINNKASGKVIYLQGLGGLRAKISFPDLAAIYSNAGGKFVLNRAELVITPSSGSLIPYGPLPKISLYRYDIANQRIPLEDANTGNPISAGASAFGGFYNSKLNEYHFLVTGYVQDLMTGKTVDYGTYISPVDTTNTQTVDINVTSATAARTIAVGNDPASPYKMKLNIIYTKTSQ
jgi:hypothetical protein